MSSEISVVPLGGQVHLSLQWGEGEDSQIAHGKLTPDMARLLMGMLGKAADEAEGQVVADTRPRRDISV